MIAQNAELRVLESFRASESIRYCEIHSTYVSVTLIFSSFPHLCMKVPIQPPCLGPRLKGTLWLRAGFPGGSDGKESACSAGDLDSIPGLGRSPREGNANPLQYSCLENSTDRGALWTTVRGVTKSRTQQSDFHFRWLRAGGAGRRSGLSLSSDCVPSACPFLHITPSEVDVTFIRHVRDTEAKRG